MQEGPGHCHGALEGESMKWADEAAWHAAMEVTRSGGGTGSQAACGRGSRGASSDNGSNSQLKSSKTGGLTRRSGDLWGSPFRIVFYCSRIVLALLASF